MDPFQKIAWRKKEKFGTIGDTRKLRQFARGSGTPKSAKEIGRGRRGNAPKNQSPLKEGKKHCTIIKPRRTSLKREKKVPTKKHQPKKKEGNGGPGKQIVRECSRSNLAVKRGKEKIKPRRNHESKDHRGEWELEKRGWESWLRELGANGARSRGERKKRPSLGAGIETWGKRGKGEIKSRGLMHKKKNLIPNDRRKGKERESHHDEACRAAFRGDSGGKKLKASKKTV